jgi:hypothetical protein
MLLRTKMLFDIPTIISLVSQTQQIRKRHIKAIRVRIICLLGSIGRLLPNAIRIEAEFLGTFSPTNSNLLIAYAAHRVVTNLQA